MQSKSVDYLVLTFARKEFDGPVYDNEGRVVYNLYTEKATFKTKPTIVTRPNGEEVGQIAWSGLSHEKKIVFHGDLYRSLISKRQEHWYTDKDWCFSDMQGRQFYWRGPRCYAVAQNNRVVAVYQHKIEHLTHADEPTTLNVERDVVYMLDLLLFTALEVEKKRKEEESNTETSNIAAESVLHVAFG